MGNAFKTVLLSLGLVASMNTTGAIASEKEIKIGTVFAMTGGIATYGQESINGIKLALKEINKEGIKGKTIKIISEDNRSETSDAASAVKKLIEIDKVSAIIGSVASSNTLAGAPIAQKAKVPLMTPASTNEDVTKVGNFISRTCFTDEFQGVVMAKFAFDSLKKKKAAIIVDVANDYSKGLAKVFKAEFEKLGGEVIDKKYSYVQKDTDFRTLLRKVKRSRPDVIFLPGYYQEVGLILKQAKQIGINVPFLGGDGWDSPVLQKLAGDAVKGNYISSHFAADDKDPLVQKFVKTYKEAYGVNPGAMAALGHDGILVMANALKRAKSLKSSDINDAIVSTKNFQGVTGLITIDKNRNAKKSAVVLETTPKGNIFKAKVSP